MQLPACIAAETCLDNLPRHYLARLVIVEAADMRDDEWVQGREGSLYPDVPARMAVETEAWTLWKALTPQRQREAVNWERKPLP